MWFEAQENIDMNPGMENIHVAAGTLKGVTQEADVIVANILCVIIIWRKMPTAY